MRRRRSRARLARRAPGPRAGAARERGRADETERPRVRHPSRSPPAGDQRRHACARNCRRLPVPRTLVRPGHARRPDRGRPRRPGLLPAGHAEDGHGLPGRDAARGSGPQLVGGAVRVRGRKDRRLRHRGHVVPRARALLLGRASPSRLPRGPADRGRHVARHRLRDPGGGSDRRGRPEQRPRVRRRGPGAGRAERASAVGVAQPRPRRHHRDRERPARLAVRLLPHQRDRGGRRRHPARLRPQHVRALQDRPADGEGPLAAGRQAERLLDGQGDTVRLPARRAPARGRPDDQPLRQRASCRRGPTGVEGDRARGRPATPAGDTEARHPAPAAALRICHRQQPAAAEREPARHLGHHGVVHRVRPRRPVCLDAHLASNGQNYRVFRFPWAAKPLVPPAFKAYRRAPERRGSTRAGTARPSSPPGGSKQGEVSGRFARAAPIRSEGSRRRSRSRRELVTRLPSRSTQRESRSGAHGRFACTSRARRFRAGIGARPSGASRPPARCACAP